MRRAIRVVPLVAAALIVVAIVLRPNESMPSIANLNAWKLTLPTDSNGDNDPDEIKMPTLEGYKSRFFRADKGRITFRANAGGTPTIGSDFARSELREMSASDYSKASWSSAKETHTMTLVQAITHVPQVRPSIVAGQLHGPDNEFVALVRLDGRKLYVKTPSGIAGVLDPNYHIGTRFALKIIAERNHIVVMYDDMTEVRIDYACHACYFKAGAYLQSNTKWDNPNAYGEVDVFSLKITP